VQAARTELAADQVNVDIKDRQFGECVLEGADQSRGHDRVSPC
jgi:hypothetical protein